MAENESPEGAPDTSHVLEKLKQPMVGIRLDIMRNIMDDLDASGKLRELFGDPVTKKLGIIAELNDLRITELNMVELSDEQKSMFLAELEAILVERIKPANE